MTEPIFISLEGVDGCGKTSVLRALLCHLESLCRRVIITREPGSSLAGDTIRGMLFTPETPGPGTARMLKGQVDCLMLFDHIGTSEGIIRPALEAGSDVITDRYADSQFAYSSVPSRNTSDAMNKAYLAHFGPVPDITFLLIGDVRAFGARAKRRDAAPNAVEPGKQNSKNWAKIGEQQMIQDAYIRNLSNQPRTIMLDITNMDAQAVGNLAIAKLDAWMERRVDIIPITQIPLFASVQ